MGRQVLQRLQTYSSSTNKGPGPGPAHERMQRHAAQGAVDYSDLPHRRCRDKARLCPVIRPAAPQANPLRSSPSYAIFSFFPRHLGAHHGSTPTQQQRLAPSGHHQRCRNPPDQAHSSCRGRRPWLWCGARKCAALGQRCTEPLFPPAARSAAGKPIGQPGRNHGRHAESANWLSSHAACAQPLGTGLYRCHEYAGLSAPRRPAPVPS